MDDGDVDELYGLPLDQFTAARNALAKRLKKDGDKEGAAAVQALKKPSVTAWALNQLAREDAGAVAGLLETGTEVRRAHRQALGGDASGLRAATRKEQQEVGALAQRAAKILEQAGSSGAAHMERLATTLRAAATDEDAGELLRRGRLVGDLDPSGFELSAGLQVVPPPPDEDGGRGSDSESKARADEAAAEEAAERAAAERQARRERERAEAEAKAAAEKAARLEREADRAEEVATAARRRAVEAREAADEAAARADRLTH